MTSACAWLQSLAALLTVPLAPAAPERRFDYDAFLKAVHLPGDFVIEPAAGDPHLRFPMFACFDDDGRLYVAESSGRDLYAGLKNLTRDCRVSRLEDADGDGRFEKAAVFTDKVTFPMGLAWYSGRLYLADPPELVALTDSDNDGRADQRDVILSGFGHTDNGSLHGLTFGPDGWLYFTMGEPDGWKLPRGDGSYLEGVAGALFRCRPDGSRLEVISRGFENLVEIEFMPSGEFIGTDNWYQRPAGGYRDALVDCAPGGLYPYAPDRGTPLPRTGVTLPPLTLVPAVAHSGLTRLRGTGFPPEWRDHLFVAEHNTRKVVRYELRREGSTFAATNHDFMTGSHPDFHPSDVIEDADGSLLVVDTGGWYVQHCPTGRIRESRAPGGIYRVRWKKAPHVDDPRSRTLNLVNISAAELADRVRDLRPAVADRAADELVRRRESAVLIATLKSAAPREAKLRALWALAQLPGAEATVALREQLVSEDLTHVCAAARAHGIRQDKDCGDDMVALLESSQAAVRRAAAESLAGCGALRHATRLVAILAQPAADDFERHAATVALLALADKPLMRTMLQHASARVRSAGLHLLDQPPFGTLRFADLVLPLGDGDAGLRAAAMSLLERHDGWADEALPWLRAQLAAEIRGESAATALAGIITGFQTNAGVRALITGMLDPATGTPEHVRAFLLNLLPSLTAQPPENDWLRAIGDALTKDALRPVALTAAAAYPQPEWEPALMRLAEDARVSAVERLLAARIASSQPLLSDSVFALTLKSIDIGAQAPDRLASVELLTHAQLSPPQLRRLIAVLQAGGPVAPDVLLPALTRAADESTRPVLAEFIAVRLKSGWRPPRAVLEKALATLPPESAAPLLKAWEANNGATLQRLKDLAPLLTGGNPGHGPRAYELATCAGCHRIGNRGGLTGPDLTKIGAIRSGSDLLESIVYPSSSFAQGYEPYFLKRRGGDLIAGTLVAQTPDHVSVRDAAGTIHRVRTADVASLEQQELSTMPAGLEQLLTRDQFRDLLAYLQGLK